MKILRDILIEKIVILKMKNAVELYKKKCHKNGSEEERTEWRKKTETMN